MFSDCRKKEIFSINRRGGDLEIIIKDSRGKILYQGWYEMKKPHKETYKEIESLIKVLQTKLKRQDGCVNVRKELEEKET